MRLLFTFLILINIPFAASCSEEGKGKPKVLAERWDQSYEEGVTIYYPNEHKGIPVSYVMLHVEDSDENYISTDLMMRPAEENFGGIDASQYKISHVYISEKFLADAKVSVKYDLPPKEGEPVTMCGPLPHLFKLSDLVSERT
ncbi:hypothetical protein [Microbulbifer sp.]|uniref:hypothetical protein n=1 Tax=Microbulbifer sp. TaxID=1908541 RepID=UPI003F408E66